VLIGVAELAALNALLHYRHERLACIIVTIIMVITYLTERITGIARDGVAQTPRRAIPNEIALHYFSP